MQEIAKKLKSYEEFAVQKLKRVRQLRSDELSTHKEEDKSSVNQLMVQNQELQDNVN